ncbi:hypothetical protein PM082_019564 [Marasmius tenuissimus]|nr:hypothetical protein PM082_019564 [Marasmius tenuissimus]
MQRFTILSATITFSGTMILIFLSALLIFTSATPLVRRDPPLVYPSHPADFINCPPGGGADKCSLEVPCKRIRINYGSRHDGHLIWYNYALDTVLLGADIGREETCTDF